jgi:hypothetical protein
VTAVPGVRRHREAMLAFVLCDALLEATGGDRMEDVLERLARHRERVRAYGARPRPLGAPAGYLALRSSSMRWSSESARRTMRRRLFAAAVGAALLGLGHGDSPSSHGLAREKIDRALPARVSGPGEIEGLRHRRNQHTPIGRGESVVSK